MKTTKRIIGAASLASALAFAPAAFAGDAGDATHGSRHERMHEQMHGDARHDAGGGCTEHHDSSASHAQQQDRARERDALNRRAQAQDQAQPSAAVDQDPVFTDQG